ncbi:hypothetical protein J3A83DRAFT_4191258 [Scleroderma citrinum]
MYSSCTSGNLGLQVIEVTKGDHVFILEDWSGYVFLKLRALGGTSLRLVGGINSKADDHVKGMDNLHRWLDPQVMKRDGPFTFQFSNSSMMSNHIGTLYYMINQLRTFKQDIADRQLYEMDWQIIEDMEIVLEVPHSAQQLMLHEMLPILSHAVPIIETVIIQWEHLTAHLPQCVPYIKLLIQPSVSHGWKSIGTLQKCLKYTILC